MKLAHSLYFTCLNPSTTKDDIRATFNILFSDYKMPISIVELHWDDVKKWGKISLSSSQVVDDFIDDEYLDANDRQIRCKPYKTAEDSQDHKRDLQLQKDEDLSNQASAQASASRIIISEKQRPKSFEPGKKYAWAITITNKTNMSKRLVSVSNFSYVQEFRVGPFKGPKDV